MQSTSRDFWIMIWEKKSHVIVMLGHLRENKEVNAFTNTTNWLPDCFIRKFALSTGQIQEKLTHLENSQLKQCQRMCGVKT